MPISSDSIQVRTRLTISGTIQGVGFRPFVYHCAAQERLSGFVRNLGGKVQIEIEGPENNIERFIANLRAHRPPLAIIKNFEQESLPLTGNTESGFKILNSASNSDDWQSVPPDTAICAECLDELFDKNNRRFNYPFINCINCGPRFTIIEALPYDREQTTMHQFKMCNACLLEYQDPLNRRFHAQPIACHDCGPHLTLMSSMASNPIETTDTPTLIEIACQHLQAGKIVAIKSLGGFHLACDATNELAVTALRQRKNRAAKPFAVMMPSLDIAQKYCQLSKQEKESLNSKQSPILLLEKLNSQPLETSPALANNIAPNTQLLGVMLPYTPLHHLLTATFSKPLIMTSGNISDEPIVIENQQAINELSNIADYLVLNDRNIATRYDDSIVRITMSAPSILRRSRGFAPQPIEIRAKASQTILSFGAQLKNTFCFLKDDQAFMSPHIGHLNNLKTIEYFEKTLEHHRQLFKMQEKIIACDMHPDYISTKLAHSLAQKKQLPVIQVQHHHAHIVSCMVEHNLQEPVIGIAFDGTGYGPDGTIWGGECLITRFDQFKRFASFELIPMPGSTQAILHPWRMALSYIQTQKDQNLFVKYQEQIKNQIGAKNINIVQQQINNKFNSPLTSSCGRLFDTISSLLDICHTINYEGQAAIELEAIALQAEQNKDPIFTYPYSIDTSALPTNNAPSTNNALYQIKTANLIHQIMEDKANDTKISVIARRFHDTIAKIITDLSLLARKELSINTVCLAGGVFQNNLLLQSTIKMLKCENFSVYYPQQVPINDGGISLGQAIIAAAQTNNLIW